VRERWLLAVVAVAATVRPALAAARTDPMALLRGKTG